MTPPSRENAVDQNAGIALSGVGREGLIPERAGVGGHHGTGATDRLLVVLIDGALPSIRGIRSRFLTAPHGTRCGTSAHCR